MLKVTTKIGIFETELAIGKKFCLGMLVIIGFW
jgi:hypothetical protein